MTKLSDQLTKAGASAVAGLPSLVQDLSDSLAKMSQTPSEAEKSFIGCYKAGDLGNAELKALKSVVLDNTASSLETLDAVRTWVQLLIPKVEDGGNFGVGIQMQLVKQLQSWREDMAKIVDDVASFHDKRQGIVEKLSEKVSTERKESSVLESVEKDKTGNSKSETTTTSKTEIVGNDEIYEALAAVDVKMYLQLKGAATLQRSNLAVASDFVEKNRQKITDPRGGSMSSYAF